MLRSLIVKINVAQEIINRRKPGRRPVPDSANLHGSRLVRHDFQRVSRRMPSKLHQDVDFVLIYHARRLLRGQPTQVPPGIHPLSQHPAEGILYARHIGIHGKRRLSFSAEHRRRKTQDHMITKIRRNISDAQQLSILVPQMAESRYMRKEIVKFRRRRILFLGGTAGDMMKIE